MSETRPRHVVAVAEGRYVTLSAEAYLMYEARLRGDDLGAICAALGRQCGRPYSVRETEHAVDALVTNLERASAEAKRTCNLPRIQLLPAAWVNAVASRLTWMFVPVVAWCICLATLAAAAASFASTTVHAVSARTWIAAYALFLVTIVAHEFGHAAACCAAGERAGPIGLTAYFMVPAFYTDVSRGWLLGRGCRLTLDIGGVYFQLPFVTLFALASLATHNATLVLAQVLVLGGIAVNLNPVLRFDGYWLLADALDLPFLGREPLRMIGALLRGQTPLPGRSRWHVAAVAAYGILNGIAWVVAVTISVVLLARRPAEVAAQLRLASTHLSGGLALHVGLTVMSIVVLAYGLVALTRVASATIRRSLPRIAGPGVTKP